LEGKKDNFGDSPGFSHQGRRQRKMSRGDKTKNWNI